MINILYDSSVLTSSMYYYTSRTGIFWVAFNILKHLQKNPLFNISLLDIPSADNRKELYINNAQSKELKKFLSSFKNFKYLNDNIYKKKINLHLINIKKTNDLIIILITILKIIKNCLLLLIIKNKVFDLYNEKIDVYFSSVYDIPEIIRDNKNIKKIIVLYDCVPILKDVTFIHKIDPEHWFSKLINNLNKETFYFCISESTRNDFLNNFGEKLDPNKMFVAHIAPAQTLHPNYNKDKLKKVLKKYDIEHDNNADYIFSFCSVDPRKNLIFTIKCFLKFINKHNIDNLYFYLGGSEYPQYIEQFENEFNSFSQFKNKIIRLGYIDDEDVNILYSNSIMFLFLSQYEGFGMPPLEAMQAGTPVICSNNASLPEVAGDAAITITYNDEDACIKAIEDLYFNEDLRKEYIAKGIERAKLFSWEKTADLISDKIKEIYGN